MTTTIPHDPAALMARLDDLQQQIDALDRGPLEVGQTADGAMAQASATHRTIKAINESFTRDSAEADYQPHRGDPVVAQIQARKRRIAASRLTLVLAGAIAAAGVQLDCYDDRIVHWMAGWEPQTCAVLVGIISRASQLGGTDLTTAPDAAV
jgi:hypothetical protein